MPLVGPAGLIRSAARAVCLAPQGCCSRDGAQSNPVSRRGGAGRAAVHACIALTFGARVFGGLVTCVGHRVAIFSKPLGTISA